MGKPNAGSSSINPMESPENKKRKRLGSDSRLWIKIKNDSAGSDLGPPPASAAPKNIKICGLCGKGFASAKALGGHMRVHFEAHTNGGGGSSSKKADKTHLAKTKKKLSGDLGMAGLVEVGSTNPATLSNNGDDQSNLVCPVCGKGFPSDKSLHGHMRCHPERDWRGIQPPLMTGAVAPSLARAKNNNSSGTSSYNSRYSSPRSGKPIGVMEVDMDSNSPSAEGAIVDLFAAGWLVKGKRGQKGSDTWKEKKREENGMVVDIGFLDFSVPMAANDLMELSQARPTGKEILIIAIANDDQDTDISAGSDQDAISASNCDQSHNDERHVVVGFDGVDESTRERRRRKAMELKSTKTEWDSDDEYWLRDHFPNEGGDHDHDHDQLDAAGLSPPRCSPSHDINACVENTRRPTALNCTKKAKGIIKMKLMRNVDMAAGSGEININKGTGGEVDRMGHRYSKNHQMKKLHHNLADDEGGSPEGSASSSDEREEQERTNGFQQLVETPGPYRCRFCPKTFLTGQALGGHQRAHWNSGATSQDTESRPQSQSEGSEDEVASRKGLGLDLNEPAIPDEEEEEDGIRIDQK